MCQIKRLTATYAAETRSRCSPPVKRILYVRMREENMKQAMLTIFKGASGQHATALPCATMLHDLLEHASSRMSFEVS
jgi:hypothetical protein